MNASPLVSTQWLMANLETPNLLVADASWYLPQAARDAMAEYRGVHIPGALFFDIDTISDRNSKLPHMLPDTAAFASHMRQLGIGNGDFVVFYDGAGIFSSPRALWTMRAMGHRKAAILDGGLPKWKREGRVVTDAISAASPRHFIPSFQAGLVRDFASIEANLQTHAEQILDARSPARFRGEEQEPRPGVRPGHIPGSLNLHYAELIAPDGTLRSPEELRLLFAARGVDLKKPAITACGSGVTAAILSLALEVAGAAPSALYDGSWAEWGSLADAPVATGN